MQRDAASDTECGVKLSMQTHKLMKQVERYTEAEARDGRNSAYSKTPLARYPLQVPKLHNS